MTEGDQSFQIKKRETTSLDAKNSDLGRIAGTAAERDALIRALYKDRSELVELELLGDIGPDDRFRLAELEREIDRWEVRDRANSTDDVWSELENIARDTLQLQTSIEAKKIRPR